MRAQSKANIWLLKAGVSIMFIRKSRRLSPLLLTFVLLLTAAVVSNGSGQAHAAQRGVGSRIVKIAAGVDHSLALKADGTVAVWGRNNHGQLNMPPGLSGVASIAAGAHHSLALKADGTVVAWGENFRGQTDVPPGLAGWWRFRRDGIIRWR